MSEVKPVAAQPVVTAPIQPNNAPKADAPKDAKAAKKAEGAAPAVDAKAAPAPQAPQGADTVAQATPNDKQAKKLDVKA